MIVVKSQERRVESQKPARALRSCSGSRPSTLDPARAKKLQNANCKMQIANCDAAAAVVWDNAPQPRAPRPQPLRAGFTLIELLVIILIIAILASLVLGVAAVAREKAKEAQTRHVVERLHTLLTDYYGSYKTRRVRLNSSVEQAIDAAFKNDSNGTRRGQALAEARLYALREMMLMEVPDRWSDVILESPDVFNSSRTRDQTALPGGSHGTRECLFSAIPAALNRINTANNPVTGQPVTLADVKNNQSAECLYMVITMACGDGEARTLFAENSIGDTDGDGAPEFIDGWGHPISFLRWAPGFDSQIQLNMNVLDATFASGSQGRTEVVRQVAQDHDPFDLFRADSRAFRLVPLIYSSGRDENVRNIRRARLRYVAKGSRGVRRRFRAAIFVAVDYALRCSIHPTA